MDLLDKFFTQAAALPHQKISRVVFSLGLIITLFLLAQITWKLVPHSADASQWRPTPIMTTTANKVDVSTLAQLSLFGRIDANANKPKPKPAVAMITDAPKTSLSILLTGVVASTLESKGLAIIASGNDQSTYSLGDSIKGTSASLKEVYADRIIITNNGRYETLMLDGLKYDTNNAASQQLQKAKSKSANKVDNRKNQAVAEELDKSRQAILADPGKITDYLKISPVNSNGELVGYRLNPGKDRSLFTSAGFKPNDLVKSINGYDLTNMGQALEVMGQLQDLTDVSLMVEREGQLIEIMFSLPQ